MQTCCLVHEEHYFVRNTFFVFLFFFKNKTVSQLFMLAVASKTCCSTLCCQQGLLSTGQAVTGVCVCACVWTLYFSPKKKAWVPTIRGFESESHFDDSFLKKCYDVIWLEEEILHMLAMSLCVIMVCILLPGDKSAQPFNATLLCSLFSG